MAKDEMSDILKELASGVSESVSEGVKVTKDFGLTILQEMATVVHAVPLPPPPAPKPLPPTLPTPAIEPPPAPPPPQVRVVRPANVVQVSDVVLDQIEEELPETQYVGEIEQFLRNKEEAARGHSDEFYQRVAIKDVVTEKLREEAPFRRTNPFSAVEAILGNAVVVQSNTTGTKAPQVARWTGEDIDCTNVTVAFGVIPPPSGNQPNIIRPYGIVQFGSKGQLETVEVDIGLGCQFTVAGSFVAVQVGMDDDGSTNAGSALLSGNMSFRKVAHGVPLTRTKYNSIGNGATATVQVPPFAKRVLFYTDTPAQTYTLTFKDWAGNTAYTFAVAANGFMTTSIPLSGDIEQVLITPQTGVVVTRLVFELAI